MRLRAGEISAADFLVETDTAALLVLRDGAICYERYALTGGPDVPWISMSVAKSVISALVGIAVDEGHISSIDQPISDYIRVTPGLRLRRRLDQGRAPDVVGRTVE